MGKYIFFYKMWIKWCFDQPLLTGSCWYNLCLHVNCSSLCLYAATGYRITNEKNKNICRFGNSKDWLPAKARKQKRPYVYVSRTTWVKAGCFPARVMVLVHEHSTALTSGEYSLTPGSHGKQIADLLWEKIKAYWLTDILTHWPIEPLFTVCHENPNPSLQSQSHKSPRKV